MLKNEPEDLRTEKTRIKSQFIQNLLEILNVSLFRFRIKNLRQ